MNRILMTILTLFLLLSATTQAGTPDLQVHGALRAMFHQGQTGTMVTLDKISLSPLVYGVGAVADLNGEITIVGGDVFLTYPGDDDGTYTEVSEQSNEGACLLVTTEVMSWKIITTEKEIPFKKLDSEIAKLAKKAGLDPDSRFCFTMQGVFDDLQWHVIDGRLLKDGGTSHKDHLAAAVTGKLDPVPATMIGFHSKTDQGVFTHKGSTTHIHFVTEEPLFSGHVDSVAIPAGTVISFSTELEQ